MPHGGITAVSLHIGERMLHGNESFILPIMYIGRSLGSNGSVGQKDLIHFDAGTGGCPKSIMYFFGRDLFLWGVPSMPPPSIVIDCGVSFPYIPVMLYLSSFPL